MKSGIYTITNIVDSKMYVGYAIDIEKRLRVHKCTLKNKYHKNTHLQNAWNLYGEDKFLFEPLVECEPEYLGSEENYWCNLLQVHDDRYGYNIAPTNSDGRKIITDETKRKIGEKNKGKPFSEEAKKKQQEAKKCYKVDQYDKDLVPIATWNSISQASKSIDVNTGAVRNCCIANSFHRIVKGKSNQYRKIKGYIFMYNKTDAENKGYKCNYGSIDNIKRSPSSKIQSIIKLDMEDNIISIYKNMVCAAKSVNKSTAASIWRVCKGEQKTAYGYKWKYNEN